MRYRLKTYTAGITSDQLEFKVEFPIPEKVAELLESHKTETYGTVDAAAQKWLLESIRLIADETQGGYVLAGTGFRSNIAGLNWWWHNNPTTVTFYFDFDTLIANANGDPDDLAAIAALSGSDSLTVEMDFGDLPPEYLESTDDAHNLAAFFNITEATEYQALTPAEAIAIARDCQYNVMGTDWPIPTWLPAGVTEAQVESAAEGLGIPYHEPTQTA